MFCDTCRSNKSNRSCLQRDGWSVCEWMWGWGTPCLWLRISEFLKLKSSHRWHLWQLARLFPALGSLPLLCDHAAILLQLRLPSPTSPSLSADGCRPSGTWHQPTSLSHLLHKDFPPLFSVLERKKTLRSHLCKKMLLVLQEGGTCVPFLKYYFILFYFLF